MDAIPRNLEFLRNHPNRMKLSSCSSPFSLQDQAMSLRIIYICIYIYVAVIVVNLLNEISTCVLISRPLTKKRYCCIQGVSSTLQSSHSSSSHRKLAVTTRSTVARSAG